MANTRRLQRLTLEQLIAASEQREAARLRVEEIEIPGLGGTLLFKRPSDEMMLDFVDSVNGANKSDTTAVTVDEMAKVIYACCDDLHSKELYEQLDVGDPVDVVHKIMDAGTILEIGDKVCSMNSIYGNATEEIKNA